MFTIRIPQAAPHRSRKANTLRTRRIRQGNNIKKQELANKSLHVLVTPAK